MIKCFIRKLASKQTHKEVEQIITSLQPGAAQSAQSIHRLRSPHCYKLCQPMENKSMFFDLTDHFASHFLYSLAAKERPWFPTFVMLFHVTMSPQRLLSLPQLLLISMPWLKFKNINFSKPIQSLPCKAFPTLNPQGIPFSTIFVFWCIHLFLLTIL